MRAQAACGAPVEQRGQALGQHLGGEAQIAAPVKADDGDVLDQQDIGRDRWHLSAGETDHQHPPVRLCGAQGGGELIAADRVIDHIRAAQRLHLGAQILGVAVDHMIGTGGAGDGQLVGPARAGDHPRAHLFADFHRAQPHAAGSPQHQQGFPRAQPRLMRQREVRGAIGDLKRGGGFEAHAFGQRHAARGGHTGGLGQPALACENRHPGARRGPGHAGAQCRDRSGEFHAQGEGGGRGVLIAPLDHQQIGEIQPAGRDFYPHLTGFRFGNRQIDQLRRLACGGHVIGAHVFSFCAVGAMVSGSA